MPPRTRARAAAAPKDPVALTDADIALLKERLDTGRRPRVTLLVDTALGAAGTTAAVISFGDAADGEYISVRLRDDVVPFAPTELAMPKRGPRPSPAADAEPPASLPLDTPAEQPIDAAKPRLVAVPDAPPAAPVPAPAALPAEDKKPAKKPARRPRAGSLAVTIRFTGDAWTYETTRSGKRSAARSLNLAAVRAFADRVDEPALRRDLQEAVDLCRQQVQSRAQALRSELEQIEVELAELEE